mmetsp:Transcript_41278/g.106886  ORF Transcript_41278/g.106886 Transcript_41278/m.106886 type:complete len:427 (-) Transcript_41278:225-1505(-)
MTAAVAAAATRGSGAACSTSSATAAAGAWPTRGTSQLRPRTASSRQQQRQQRRLLVEANATGRDARERTAFRTTKRDGNFKRPPLPLLSAEQIVYRRRNNVHANGRDTFRSFFSSEVGGITTDPGLMMIGMDDHMVHRGHGVFDTCLLANGQLYMLEQHIDRLLASAAKAGIRDFYKRSTIKNIVHDVAAASGLVDGLLRYWLTAGNGGFGLSSAECVRPGFYCIATSIERPKPRNEREKLTGQSAWQALTPSTEVKSAFMSGIKSNNYLLNALAADEAVADDHSTGHAVWVDADGYVSEGGNFNVGFITNNNEVVIPTFDNCLAGCTAQRVLELIPKTPELSHLTVSQRKITEAEAKMECREMFALGSTAFATPITSWDQKVYNNGDTQFESHRIRQMLINDIWGAPHELHTEVDYSLISHGQGP